MEIILLIRSESNPEEPHKLLFNPDDKKLRCFCPAGTTHMLCKHVLDLLSGGTKFMFDAGQADDFAAARVMAENLGAVAYAKQMDLQLKKLKREYQAACQELKEELCARLREGRSFE